MALKTFGELFLRGYSSSVVSYGVLCGKQIILVNCPLKSSTYISPIFYRYGSFRLARSFSTRASSGHEPASLDLRSSAGSQAAQAATIGALASVQQSAVSPNELSGTTSGTETSVRDNATMDSHGHQGNVSLHSAMQSNVPEPYAQDSRSPSHMNMPQGGVMREAKFSSDHRHTLAAEDEQQGSTSERVSDAKDGGVGVIKVSQTERMKKAVKEYGSTVIVFHTSISLCTLGISYMAVSSGLDVIGLLTKLGVGETLLESKIATGASTFVIAYAVHKVFAPARMATTLAATPLIVRYLRKIGFLKAPVSQGPKK